MKNQLWLISIAALAIGLFGCNKEHLIDVKALDETLDAKTIQAITQQNDMGIPFPEGSMAIEMNDGRVKISLPKGYQFLMTDTGTGNIMVEGGDGGEIGVTCTCTSGTGCSPVKYNSKYYCVMEENCKTCTKSASMIDGTPVNIEGIYQPDKGITFIAKRKQEGFFAALSSLKEDVIAKPSPKLFELPEVKKQLFDLYHFIYGKDIPEFILTNASRIPEGYVYIGINIMGNEAAIPFPKEKLGTEEYIVAMGDGSVSCKCNDASPSGCSLNSAWGVKYCRAGTCKSCSLLD